MSQNRSARGRKFRQKISSRKKTRKKSVRETLAELYPVPNYDIHHKGKTVNRRPSSRRKSPIRKISNSHVSSHPSQRQLYQPSAGDSANTPNVETEESICSGTVVKKVPKESTSFSFTCYRKCPHHTNIAKESATQTVENDNYLSWVKQFKESILEELINRSRPSNGKQNLSDHCTNKDPKEGAIGSVNQIQQPKTSDQIKSSETLNEIEFAEFTARANATGKVNYVDHVQHTESVKNTSHPRYTENVTEANHEQCVDNVYHSTHVKHTANTENVKNTSHTKLTGDVKEANHEQYADNVYHSTHVRPVDRDKYADSVKRTNHANRPEHAKYDSYVKRTGNYADDVKYTNHDKTTDHRKRVHDVNTGDYKIRDKDQKKLEQHIALKEYVRQKHLKDEDRVNHDKRKSVTEIVKDVSPDFQDNYKFTSKSQESSRCLFKIPSQLSEARVRSLQVGWSVGSGMPPTRDAEVSTSSKTKDMKNAATSSSMTEPLLLEAGAQTPNKFPEGSCSLSICPSRATGTQTKLSQASPSGDDAACQRPTCPMRSTATQTPPGGQETPSTFQQRQNRNPPGTSQQQFPQYQHNQENQQFQQNQHNQYNQQNQMQQVQSWENTWNNGMCTCCSCYGQPPRSNPYCTSHGANFNQPSCQGPRWEGLDDESNTSTGRNRNGNRNMTNQMSSMNSMQQNGNQYTNQWHQGQNTDHLTSEKQPKPSQRPQQQSKESIRPQQHQTTHRSKEEVKTQEKTKQWGQNEETVKTTEHKRSSFDSFKSETSDQRKHMSNRSSKDKHNKSMEQSKHGSQGIDVTSSPDKLSHKKEMGKSCPCIDECDDPDCEGQETCSFVPPSHMPPGRKSCPDVHGRSSQPQREHRAGFKPDEKQPHGARTSTNSSKSAINSTDSVSKSVQTGDSQSETERRKDTLRRTMAQRHSMNTEAGSRRVSIDSDQFDDDLDDDSQGQNAQPKERSKGGSLQGSISSHTDSERERAITEAFETLQVSESARNSILSTFADIDRETRLERIFESINASESLRNSILSAFEDMDREDTLGDLLAGLSESTRNSIISEFDDDDLDVTVSKALEGLSESTRNSILSHLDDDDREITMNKAFEGLTESTRNSIMSQFGDDDRDTTFTKALEGLSESTRNSIMSAFSEMDRSSILLKAMEGLSESTKNSIFSAFEDLDREDTLAKAFEGLSESTRNSILSAFSLIDREEYLSNALKGLSESTKNSILNLFETLDREDRTSRELNSIAISESTRDSIISKLEDSDDREEELNDIFDRLNVSESARSSIIRKFQEIDQETGQPMTPKDDIKLPPDWKDCAGGKSKCCVGTSFDIDDTNQSRYNSQSTSKPRYDAQNKPKSRNDQNRYTNYPGTSKSRYDDNDDNTDTSRYQGTSISKHDEIFEKGETRSNGVKDAATTYDMTTDYEDEEKRHSQKSKGTDTSFDTPNNFTHEPNTKSVASGPSTTEIQPSTYDSRKEKKSEPFPQNQRVSSGRGRLQDRPDCRFNQKKNRPGGVRIGNRSFDACRQLLCNSKDASCRGIRSTRRCFMRNERGSRHPALPLTSNIGTQIDMM